MYNVWFVFRIGWNWIAIFEVFVKYMKKRKSLGEKNEWTKVEEKYRGLKIAFHYSNHLISNERKNALILSSFLVKKKKKLKIKKKIFYYSFQFFFFLFNLFSFCIQFSIVLVLLFFLAFQFFFLVRTNVGHPSIMNFKLISKTKKIKKKILL